MADHTDKNPGFLRKHRILGGILAITALGVVAYLGLVVMSLGYDRSDPRALPHSYRSVEKVEIVNGDSLVAGAEIDCVEGDHREVVKNRYVVREVIDNRLIAYLTFTRDDRERQFREQNRNLAAFAREAL